MEQSPSSEVKSSSCGQEIPHNFMELKGSSTCSQEPATCICPEQDESSVRPFEEPF
jgi:hypothetical protein